MKENRPNRQSNTQAKATRGTRKEQPSARLVVAYALLQMMRQSAYSNLVAESGSMPGIPQGPGLCLHPVLWGAGAADHPAAHCGCLLPQAGAEARPRGAVHSGDGAIPALLLDSVPERAAVNESVLLTRKLGKQSAGGFLNGVLRALSGMENPSVPARRSSRRWSAFRRRLRPRRSCASC